MNHAKHIVGIALSALIITGCASSGGSSASSSEAESAYQQAMSEAKKALNDAHKANNVWRDSGKMLKKADEAAKTGDFETATKLALKAKRQGELAVLQAESQKNAGPNL